MKKITLILLTLIFLISCKSEIIQDKEPEQIVREYYNSFDNKNYEKMYELISEGFKKIEPTAKTLDEFKSYMAKFYDSAKGIKLKTAEITSNDGTKATVDYLAIIEMKNGQNKELKSTFTLKKKENGWKLIHPYGENIDTS